MRSPARRRPLDRRRGSGRWVWWGPLEEDAITGVRHPRQLMVRQRGQWVNRDWNYGSRDRDQSY